MPARGVAARVCLSGKGADGVGGAGLGCRVLYDIWGASMMVSSSGMRVLLTGSRTTKSSKGMLGPACAANVQPQDVVLPAEPDVKQGHDFAVPHRDQSSA